MEPIEIIGNIGVVLLLAAYFLLQKGRLGPASPSYLFLNLAGSLLILASLLVHWNLPAFLVEAAWALISIYGIVKHLVLNRAK